MSYRLAALTVTASVAALGWFVREVYGCREFVKRIEADKLYERSTG